jgi:hypothetical protein
LTIFEPPSGIDDPVDYCTLIIKEARKEDRLVKQVKVTGAVLTNERDIRVPIPNVPTRKWRVIRAQINYTDESWKA